MSLLVVFLCLIGIIILGIIHSNIHIGVFAFTTAWILSLVYPSSPRLDAAQLLPIKLLLNISGISLLFLFAEQNGTLEKIAGAIQRLAGRRIHLIPLTVFASSALLSAFGAGNIGSTAIAAAPAMRMARDLRLSPFLMCLMVVGGSNSTALSPFAVTGILNRELLAKQGFENLDPLGWKIFAVCFLGITMVHLLGFYFLGGWKWSRAAQLDALAPKNVLPWTIKQKFTAAVLLSFVALLLLAGNNNWTIIQDNVGGAALVFVNVFMLLQIGEVKACIRKMPWDTILLIGGMYSLISLLEKSGYQTLMSGLISNPNGVYIVLPSLALAAAGLSAFSSSSGVVMPLFIPLTSQLLGLDAALSVLSVTSMILISAHIVDTSPFSSLGALCISNISSDSENERKKTFYDLLYWGLAMIPGALIASFLVLAGSILSS